MRSSCPVQKATKRNKDSANRMSRKKEQPWKKKKSPRMWIVVLVKCHQANVPLIREGKGHPYFWVAVACCRYQNSTRLPVSAIGTECRIRRSRAYLFHRGFCGDWRSARSANLVATKAKVLYNFCCSRFDILWRVRSLLLFRVWWVGAKHVSSRTVTAIKAVRY